MKAFSTTQTSQTPTTNQSLLDELRADPDSPRIDEFARIYEPVMRRYATYAVLRLRNGLCDADRDDLAQEAFLAVRSALRSYRYDPAKGRFRNYVSGIIRHLALRALDRKSKLLEPGPEAMEAIAGGDGGDASTEDERELIRQAYGLALSIVVARRSFTPNTLAVFQSHVIDGVPAKEVAEAFKLKVNAVLQIKDRIFRAVRKEINSAREHSSSGDLAGVVDELFSRGNSIPGLDREKFFSGPL